MKFKELIIPFSTVYKLVSDIYCKALIWLCGPAISLVSFPVDVAGDQP